MWQIGEIVHNSVHLCPNECLTPLLAHAISEEIDAPIADRVDVTGVGEFRPMCATELRKSTGVLSKRSPAWRGLAFSACVS